VHQLDRPQHRPNNNKLTQEAADAIRARLATGARGVDLAKEYGVSETIISSVKHGDIWNPANIKPGTKGTEMERRLIGALDGGLRAGEMLGIQLTHVNWRPILLDLPDGSQTEAYEIVLPPVLTKGGKTTGETEYVYAVTARFRHVLEARRFALKNNPPSRQFIFGFEDGRQQKGFRRMWNELFTLAGLNWGRDKGLVWHTTRHENISRHAENTGGDSNLTMELARHHDIKTTLGYIHTQRSRLLTAAAGLERKRR
jgi:integrase